MLNRLVEIRVRSRGKKDLGNLETWRDRGPKIGEEVQAREVYPPSSDSRFSLYAYFFRVSYLVNYFGG